MFNEFKNYVNLNPIECRFYSYIQNKLLLSKMGLYCDHIDEGEGNKEGVKAKQKCLFCDLFRAYYQIT